MESKFQGPLELAWSWLAFSPGHDESISLIMCYGIVFLLSAFSKSAWHESSRLLRQVQFLNLTKPVVS